MSPRGRKKTVTEQQSNVTINEVQTEDFSKKYNELLIKYNELDQSFKTLTCQYDALKKKYRVSRKHMSEMGI